MVMEAEGAKIPADAVPKIYFCDMGGETRMLAQSLAARLRAKGIWAEHDLMGRGLKAQMKYANKLGAEYTAVIGETELTEGKGKLKRMSDGIETEVAYAELESALL